MIRELGDWIILVDVKLKGKATFISQLMQRNANEKNGLPYAGVDNDSGRFINKHSKSMRAVYMVYKITNKDNNPRKVWKR